MQRSLDYLRYTWKAKGRHGTHSPFVYAFVEQVLRNKQPLPFFKRETEKAVPGLKYLIRTISYLGTETLVLFQPGLAPLQSIISAVHPRQKIITEKGITMPENTLVLIDASRLCPEELDYLEHWRSPDPFGLYFLNPHAAGSVFKKYERFHDWNDYPMSLDFWKGLLLFRHPDFKEKQHFFLR